MDDALLLDWLYFFRSELRSKIFLIKDCIEFKQKEHGFTALYIFNSIIDLPHGFTVQSQNILSLKLHWAILFISVNLIIKKIGSSTSHKKTKWLWDISYILSYSSFIYKPISMIFSMNANIMKMQLFLKFLFYCKGHWRLF